MNAHITSLPSISDTWISCNNKIFKIWLMWNISYSLLLNAKFNQHSFWLNGTFLSSPITIDTIWDCFFKGSHLLKTPPINSFISVYYRFINLSCIITATFYSYHNSRVLGASYEVTQWMNDFIRKNNSEH